MNETNILVVAPYEGMLHMVKTIIAEKKLQHVNVVLGDLLLGLDSALEEIHNNRYDLILSRGGTAELLMQQTSLPVLEIPITTTDIIQVMKMSENYHDSVAIVGYKTIIHKAKKSCELMDWHPTIITLENKSEVQTVIENLKEGGCKLVLGDVITVKYCKKIGIESVLILSSRDTLEDTLNQAYILVNSINNSNQLYRECYKSNNPVDRNSFTLIYNDNGSMLISSISQNNIPTLVKKYINTAFFELLQLPHSRKDLNDNNIHFILLTKHFILDKSSYLIVKVTIINITTDVFDGFNVSDKTSLLQRVKSPSTINFFGTTGESITSCRKKEGNILIVGEPYTGKTSCINYLFLNGKYSDHSFYLLDFAKLSNEQWVEIKRNLSLELLKQETICFANLDSANYFLLNEVETLVSRHDFCKVNQLIFTYTLRNTSLMSLSEVTEKLILNDAHEILFLPPLRERKDDFNKLITIYLNRLNTLYGKNVIGFDNSARKIVLSYPWPGNLKQFKRVLKKIVIDSKHYYISEELLSNTLEEEAFNGYSPLRSNKNDLQQIDLSQTLNEMIYDIIEIVLANNNMNQTKTAKKLNIGRSTLWRILKNGKAK